MIRLKERENKKNFKKKKERKKEIVDWERERERETNKILYFVLELSYNAILNVELHCSTIPNIFAIVAFYNSGCRGYFGLVC